MMHVSTVVKQLLQEKLYTLLESRRAYHVVLRSCKAASGNGCVAQMSRETSLELAQPNLCTDLSTARCRIFSSARIPPQTGCAKILHQSSSASCLGLQ